jgi:two-component system, LytTR family, response regulator
MNPAAPMRTLLIDDEVLARLALRQALASHPDVVIVGECGNAAEALRAIPTLGPDLMFVDIQMPGADGFTLLHEIKTGRLPITVFVTAFNQHALRAFDDGALDYVLKPIDQARFDRAMARVRLQWQGLRGAAAGEKITTAPAPLARLSVRSGERIVVLATEDIDWIGAEGNYVRIHAGRTSYLHRQCLRDLLRCLDPARFLRVHRGTIVNIDRVREVHPLFAGNAELVLRDGTRLGLSRRFRSQARQALGLQ